MLTHPLKYKHTNLVHCSSCWAYILFSGVLISLLASCPARPSLLCPPCPEWKTGKNTARWEIVSVGDKKEHISMLHSLLTCFARVAKNVLSKPTDYDSNHLGILTDHAAMSLDIESLHTFYVFSSTTSIFKSGNQWRNDVGFRNWPPLKSVRKELCIIFQFLFFFGWVMFVSRFCLSLKSIKKSFNGFCENEALKWH